MSNRLVERFVIAGPEARARFLASLTRHEARWFEEQLVAWARAQANTGTAVSEWEPLPHQVPPDDFAAREVYGWALLAGRGSGKTLTGARWLDEQARTRPGTRWGVVAPTLPDGRALCVEGPTGLLAVNPSIEFNRSRYELKWPNGSYAELRGAYTPEDRQRLRGRQWHGAWCEEFASWRQLDERPDPDDPDAWQAVEIACRLGDFPQVVVTSTPKRRARVRELLERGDVLVSHAQMDDNPHLSEVYRSRLLERFGGTRLAKQELRGMLLEDVVGAHWTEEVLVRHRVPAPPDELARIVVGVDPPGGATEAGIVAVGVSRQRWPHPQTGRPAPHGYVLDDVSVQAPPEVWGKAAVDLYHRLGADLVVGESNYGGDMVASTIRNVDSSVPTDLVHASRGKAIRAEPVAALYAQGLFHHVGTFPELEDEMTTWTDSDKWSPNRMDALVWAATELMDRMTTQRAQVGRARNRTVPSGIPRAAGGRR